MASYSGRVKILPKSNRLRVLVFWNLQTDRLGLFIVTIRVLRVVSRRKNRIRVGLALRHLLMQTAWSLRIPVGGSRVTTIAVCWTNLVQLTSLVNFTTLRHLVQIVVVEVATGLVAGSVRGGRLRDRVSVTQECTRLASLWSVWVDLSLGGRRDDPLRTLCNTALRLGVFTRCKLGLVDVSS